MDDRLKLDRHRLECGHLLFAALKVCKWYPGIISQLDFELGEFDKLLLDMVPKYYLAFSSKYAGEEMFS